MTATRPFAGCTLDGRKAGLATVAVWSVVYRKAPTFHALCMSFTLEFSPCPIDVTAGARVFGQHLSKRVTWSGLATAIGVSFQQVQKYERTSNRVSASRLWRIAAALDVPMT